MCQQERSFQININKAKLNPSLLQIEDANFFVNASLNAIGSECKSPSSVHSGSAGAAIGGLPCHVAKDSDTKAETFVFPSTAGSSSSAIAEVSCVCIV